MILVIGFNSENNFHFSHKLDVDIDIDPPKKIYDLLKKQALKDTKDADFTIIVCFDDDGSEVAVFEDGEDFLIGEDEQLEDELDDDNDDGGDNLHDEDDEEDNNDDD